MRRIWLLVAVATLALPVVAESPVSAKANPFYPFVVDGFSNANGTGFWLAWFDGSVTSEGTAHHFGDASSLPLNQPIVGGAAHGGAGYWLVGQDGGVFSFGSARFHGSLGDAH